MKEAENPFLRIEQRLYQLTQAMENIQSQLSKISALPTVKPLSITEAAEYLNIPKGTLYIYTHRRDIPHIKRGRRLFFYVSELDQWLQTHHQKTKAEIEAEA